MPVKIRLMRIGAKKRPFYRVVAVDEQKKRTGSYIELLGTYNPLTEPKEIILKQDRIDTWLKQGAQPSDGFLRIIGKAPQRPPRKPKKAPAEGPAAPASPSTQTEAAEAPAEGTATEPAAGEPATAAENTAPAEEATTETPAAETETTAETAPEEEGAQG